MNTFIKIELVNLDLKKRNIISVSTLNYYYKVFFTIFTVFSLFSLVKHSKFKTNSPLN